ncbi:MAG: amidohydrolase family protein, partial [Deltaproteobacteria bacterium]|nr:amidohydrolase family protein [Deltaproteobacteria bacterium]
FIDPHTHYDAQICWDPLLSPSCWHGITTVLMGNCGVGVAPCRPAAKEVVAWDLVNVEALPYEVLIRGASWEWESFGDYLASIARRGIALNAAFLVPLSALRYYVVGEEASERAATPAETEQMARLFHDAMKAGAYGFSLSTIRRHMGFQGKPLASRLAGKDELDALCQVMREMKRGVIEIALMKQIGTLADDELDLLIRLARESQRPVTWLALLDMPGMGDANERILERVRPFMQQGLRIPPQVTPRPVKMYYDLRTPSLCGEMPSWRPAFNRSREEQIALYRSDRFREQFRDDLQAHRGAFFNGQWEAVTVAKVAMDEHKALLNKSIREVAELQRKHPVDAFLDLAIAENLELGITVQLINADQSAVARLISRPEVMIGLSDAGAHVSQHCEAGSPTYMLREWVYKNPVMSLETAVKRVTSEPADFLGLRNKGRIHPGMDADLVVFDPATVGTQPLEWVNDLPGGAPRLIERSQGIIWSIIGGEVVFANNEYQGVMPGQVLKPIAA